MVESDFLLGPVAGTILSLPLFDGGQRKAGVAQARAAYEESVANYRQTVLNAFREVENGLSDQRILDQQIQAQNQALSSSRHANQLSHLRYREGAISYLDVIDSDRTILQQEQLAAQLKGSQIIASINLIRALGAVGVVNKKRLTALFIYTNYFAYTGNFAQTASTFAFTSAITFRHLCCQSRQRSNQQVHELQLHQNHELLLLEYRYGYQKSQMENVDHLELSFCSQ